MTKTLYNRSIFMRILLQKYSTVLFLLALVATMYVAAKTPVLLILGALFVVALFAFRHHPWIPLVATLPTFALGTFLAFPIANGTVVNMYLGEAFLALAVSVLVFQFLFGVRKWEWKRIDSVIVLLFLYLLIGVSLYSFITAPKWYVLELKTVALSLLAYVVARFVITTSSAVRWFTVACATLLLMLSAEVFWYIAGHGITTELIYDRNFVALPAGAAAFVSALLAFLLPIVFSRAQESDNGLERILYFVSSGIGLFALFLFMSKAAIASFFLGAFLYFRRTRKTSSRSAVWFIGAVALAVVLLFPYVAKFADRVTSAVLDVSSQYRLEEYKLVWMAAKDSLLFGLGPGQHIVFYQKFVYPDFVNLLNNYFLQAFADLGIFGVVITSGLCISVYWIVRRTRSVTGAELLASGIVAACAVAAVNGLAEVTFFGIPYAVIFWISVGMLANFPDIFTKRVKQEKNV